MDPFEKPEKVITRFTMYRDLLELPHDYPLPFGYRVEPWFPPLMPAFAAALAVSFSDSPDISAYSDLVSKDGCLLILNEIVNAPGFLSGASWLVFFRREPCGLIVCSVSPNGSEGIVNILGIAPRHRRMALGQRVLIKGLWAMRDRKIPRAQLTVNRDCRGAVIFFRSQGFQVSESKEYF
jgi:ribosomal protein S18 acetylase RimI-like enzyme